MPSFLIATSFLGQWCGSGSTQGVNPEMRLRLQTAEATVQATFDALPPAQRIDPSSGNGNASFADWARISGPHVCWQPNSGHHSAGSAIDINPATNPYFVTRDGAVAGGEEGGEGLVEMRNRALAACDRALQFVSPSGTAVDLRSRQPGESTAAVWTRFKAASDALAIYLQFAVSPVPARVERVAIANAEEISDDELLAAIPEGERIPLAEALPHLEGSREQYVRILRDYELARIPMVIGEPSATPAQTRNPARGFLNLRCEIVTALCDAGLRWGACDFAVKPDGSSPNGAMMHFDLADDGGYPEINSLLRFG